VCGNCACYLGLVRLCQPHIKIMPIVHIPDISDVTNSPFQMTQPLPPPSSPISAAAKARHEQLTKHLALHSYTVVHVALSVSRSFTPVFTPHTSTPACWRPIQTVPRSARPHLHLHLFVKFMIIRKFG
jgi:hypothetical protein